MFRDDHISVFHRRLETFVYLDTPSTFFKRLALNLALLQWRCVLPPGEEAWFKLLVQSIVNWNLVYSSCGYEFFEMENGVGFFHAFGEESIELPFWVEEVIVRIHDHDRGGSSHFEDSMEFSDRGC